MIPLVLVHGGGFDSRCWDPLLPHLTGPVIAVDLPGRGTHPAPLASVTFADCAATVVEDVDAAGFDEVVVVGHSLAGCSLPAIVGVLGDRVRHVVFLACTVPDDGTSCLDTLDPEIQALARDRAAAPSPEPAVMDGPLTRLVLGDDLDEAQLAWCAERFVPEALRLTTDPVDLAPLRSPLPRTWIRTLRDKILPPERQAHFARTVAAPLTDLDAGHMCMVSPPPPPAPP
ncbi:MAG TPA: alpha/beta hydrolase, partial [Acidimicrobiales bacterium]|nr:alpha/beta hydrolase [Acidimicrobiales bacterium]